MMEAALKALIAQKSQYHAAIGPVKFKHLIMKACDYHEQSGEEALKRL